MDVLTDAGDQVLALHSSFKEGKDWGQLGGPIPLFCSQVVAIDIVRTENWPSLRARNLILLLDLLPVLLLPVWVLGQLCELVGELVPIYLLNRVQQNDRGVLDGLQRFR